MAEALTLPEMPNTVLVWNGPAAEKALIEAGITIALIPPVLELHPETVRRWFLPPGHPKSVQAPGWAQSVLAGWARVAIYELLRPVTLIHEAEPKQARKQRTGRPRDRWRVGSEVPQLV